MTDSSQFNSSQNFQMDHHYISEEDSKPKPLLQRLGSDFSSPEGDVEQPYQYTRGDSLTVPHNVMNAAFNLNSFEKPHGGRKLETASDSSAGGLPMVNPSGEAMKGNIGHPWPNMNFGTPLFSPQHAGAVPLNCPGKIDESLINFDAGGNTEAKSNTNIARINVTGSEMEFLPPVNTYHSQMGSRSFLNPGFDMNSAFYGFQNNNEDMSDFGKNVGVWVHSSNNNKVMSDARPGLSLRPSYAFQRSAAGDQNHYFRPVKRDLGLGRRKDIGTEFADVGCKSGFERCTALSSLPFVGSQAMLYDIGRNRASGQLVPASSTGMIINQSSFEQLPRSNMNFDGKLSSQSSTSPLLVMTTGNPVGQDPSSNLGQPQVVGSIQPSNTPLGLVLTSDPGIQTLRGNTNAQDSRPSFRSSLKRVAFPPQPPSNLVQRRKTLPTPPFIHSSIPTSIRSSPAVRSTTQAIPPLTQTALSLTPQAHSFIHPFIPTSTRSALSIPTIPQTVPPLIYRTPSLPPQACATVSLTPHENITTSFFPSPRPPSVPHQPKIAQSPRPLRWRAPIIRPAPKIASVYIKYKDSDQTPEPVGHKCLLCKRDLSYTPEGPIFQPSVLPVAAVLPCGHTFHDFCLKRITSEEQSEDAPCIPCALGE